VRYSIVNKEHRRTSFASYNTGDNKQEPGMLALPSTSKGPMRAESKKSFVVGGAGLAVGLVLSKLLKL